MSAHHPPKRVLDRALVLTPDGARPELPLIDGGGTFRAVVWPGIGAVHRSLHHIALEPDASTVPLSHPSEAVYYVVEGDAVVVDLDDGERTDLTPGAMVLVEPGTTYRLAAGSAGATWVGGPCPPDPALYGDLLAAADDDTDGSQ